MKEMSLEAGVKLAQSSFTYTDHICKISLGQNLNIILKTSSFYFTAKIEYLGLGILV